MSSVRSRSMSCSRSRSSRTSSMMSRRSVKPNYFQIANELINGAPIDSVLKRDLRHVLVHLSILRNEASSLKDYVKVDYIGDIIKALNKRVTPPPVHRFKNSPTRSTAAPSEHMSYCLHSENHIMIRNNNNNNNSNSNNFDNNIVNANNDNIMISIVNDEPVDSLGSEGSYSVAPIIVKELPPEEFQKLSDEIDHMILSSEGLLEIEDYDLPKYLFVINQRKEEKLDKFEYDDVKALDELYDKLRFPARYKKSQWEIKKELLKARILKANNELEELKGEKDQKLKSLEQEKYDKLNKLKEKQKIEFDDFLTKLPKITDPSENRPSITLTEMNRDARRFAKARDYEGAKSMHNIADQKHIEETKENQRKYYEKCGRLTDQIKQKQEAECFCLKQKLDRKISEKLAPFDKMIDLNNCLIESAQKELESLNRTGGPSPKKLNL